MLSCGRMNNTEGLNNLDSLLDHLCEAKQVGLVELIKSLFGVTSSQAHLNRNYIDVRDVKPIKQHSYHVYEEKCKYLDAELKYILENNIAVQSYSS